MYWVIREERRILCFRLWIPRYPITFLQTAGKNYIWSLYYWYNYPGRAVRENQQIMHCLTTAFWNLTSSALQQVKDWESSDVSHSVLNQPNNQSAHERLDAVLVWVPYKRMNGEGSDRERDFRP